MILLLLSACAEHLDLDTGGSEETVLPPPDPRCVALERPPTDAAVEVERLWSDVSLKVPVALIQAPDDPDHVYVVQKKGIITRLSFSDPEDVREVLDLSDHVYSSYSEAGMLGLAFHPSWPVVPEIYVNYTDGDYENVVSHVVRVRSADGETFDPATEEELLRLEQPFANHNGGSVVFGPDGLLYLGFGDGGSAGDPYGNGQDTTVWLGKILRIDVDGGSPYAIPDDNPFADGEGGAPEVYAWGLRNPWRFSFDGPTGELWVGDVGQGEWEEVDVVERGGNYGWDAREGTHCFTDSLCDDPDLIDPVLEYPHTEAGGSIVGGHVYRGAAIPALQGTYLYADTVSGGLFQARPDPVTGALVHTPLIEALGFQPTSFGTDADEELYLLGYTEGGIYRLTPGDDAGNVDFPQKLSETGCARPSDPSEAVETMIPYAVNVELWSDGAGKDRWFSIPEGATITVDEAGDFSLPEGSVVRKDFFRDGAPVETRLLMHDHEGWAGYSFRWEGDDATLLSGGEVDASGWEFPSRGACLQCHTAAAGQTLGLEQAQVDRGGQLAAWASLLEAQPGVLPLPQVDSGAPLADRARAYLHANCAFCHRPEGVAGVQMDLRFTTPLAEAGFCDVPPEKGELGVTDARLLAPGAPARSVLLLRMQDEGLERMPPIGTRVVDDAGAMLVAQWIASLVDCQSP